jgi:preprotein translocase subunit SecE
MWGFESLLPCQFLGSAASRHGGRRAGMGNTMADAIRRNREEEIHSREVSGFDLMKPAEKLGAYPKRLQSFLHDVRLEMNKVNWPSRADVWSTTVIVIVTVAFFAGYFLLTDTILSSARQWLFHYFEH